MAQARILVVDDEPDIVESVADTLQAGLGAEVIQCRSAAEGLQRLKADPVDVVVSDYRMPGMDGVTFLAQVRQDRPGVPRVLITAYPDIDLAIRATNEAAVTHFLTKPVDPGHLVGVVRKALEQSRRDRMGREALQRATAGRGDAP